MKHYYLFVLVIGLFACENGLSNSSPQSLNTPKLDKNRLFAGAAGQAGYSDGSPAAARFNNPSAFAADSAGNIYIADTGNNAIRRISQDPASKAWQVSTFIGPNTATPTHAYWLDAPKSIVIDAGNDKTNVADDTMYIADKGRILKLKGNLITVLNIQNLGAPFRLQLQHYKDAEMFATKAAHDKAHSRQKLIQELERKYGKKPFWGHSKIDKGAREWAEKDHRDFERAGSHDKKHKKYGDHSDLMFQDVSLWRVAVIQNGVVQAVETIAKTLPLNPPRGMALLQKDAIYMLDSNSHAIYRWAKGNSSP